jgi:hypothetical protein
MARNGACGPAPTVARYRRRRKKRHALYVPSSSWHPHPASTSLSLFRFGPKPLPKCKRKPLVVALALKCRVRLDYPRTPIIKSKLGRFRFGRDKQPPCYPRRDFFEHVGTNQEPANGQLLLVISPFFICEIESVRNRPVYPEPESDQCALMLKLPIPNRFPTQMSTSKAQEFE